MTAYPTLLGTALGVLTCLKGAFALMIFCNESVRLVEGFVLNTGFV